MRTRLTAAVASVAACAVIAPATLSAAPAPGGTPQYGAGGPVGTVFTAWGAPSWSAVVRGGRLTVKSKPFGTFSTRVKRKAYSKGADFTGKRGRVKVVFGTRAGTCKDRTGTTFGLRATLKVGKRTVKGCAVPGVVRR